MSGNGSRDDSPPLAMSGDNSPWGGRGAAPEETGKAGDPAPGSTAGSSGETGGNPWLPPGRDEASRRSAGLDDILRQRRGGGGGPLRRLPGGRAPLGWWRWVLAGPVSASVGRVESTASPRSRASSTAWCQIVVLPIPASR